jgi:hypothetical protein
MTIDEIATEAELQSKSKTAPRLTPGLIDAQIAGEYWGRASNLFPAGPTSPALECLTIAVLVLKNGFTVVGTSACASPENFDLEIGGKLARENARRKIWELEGYALKTRLAERLV